ncbi:hypothetical protein [Xylella taiwanensis]|nr:hypothetical protein [Xylella taiwanensis]
MSTPLAFTDFMERLFDTDNHHKDIDRYQYSQRPMRHDQQHSNIE